ncbi:MAG: class I SAM-dependent methyltransferase [Candidatus Kariarchaeaceae archaeon]|jgi:magnesium-protoporphyrin O-methyltransferase
MQEEEQDSDKSKALYFDSWYKTEAKPLDYEDFSETAKLHVEKIVEVDASSALDIGCGAGGILLALQSKGVEKVYGVDASEEAIKLASMRFEKFGKIEGFEGIHSDMADVQTPVTDAVSLHRVLCCFPDYIQLIEKSTAKDATVIVMTYPRSRLINKFLTLLENGFLSLVSIFKKRIRGLKGYNHSEREVRSEMETRGYSLSHEKIGFYWKTEVYTKKN